MRFNDKVLLELSSNIPVIEGRLHHKRCQPGNFSHTGFKEGWYKLIANVLFSFHLSETGQIDEKKPTSALILENSFIQYESSREASFAFSITFKDEIDKKHIFSGRSEEYVNHWVSVMKEATYEYWRAKLLQLQYKICTLTGQDPLLMVPSNTTQPLPFEFKKSLSQENEHNNSERKISFKSYVPPSSLININRTLSSCTDKPKPTELSSSTNDLMIFDENHFANNSLLKIGADTKRKSPSPNLEPSARIVPSRIAPSVPTAPSIQTFQNITPNVPSKIVSPRFNNPSTQTVSNYNEFRMNSDRKPTVFPRTTFPVHNNPPFSNSNVPNQVSSTSTSTLSSSIPPRLQPPPKAPPRARKPNKPPENGVGNLIDL